MDLKTKLSSGLFIPTVAIFMCLINAELYLPLLNQISTLGGKKINKDIPLRTSLRQVVIL